VLDAGPVGRERPGPDRPQPDADVGRRRRLGQRGAIVGRRDAQAVANACDQPADPRPDLAADGGTDGQEDGWRSRHRRDEDEHHRGHSVDNGGEHVLGGVEAL